MDQSWRTLNGRGISIVKLRATTKESPQSSEDGHGRRGRGAETHAHKQRGVCACVSSLQFFCLFLMYTTLVV